MSEAPLALAAGLLTVAAPCVLPMLPLVLGASVGQADRWRPVGIAAGFALAFAVLGLAFAATSQAAGLTQESLRDVAAVLLMVFGLLMLWPQPLEWAAARLSGPLNRLHGLGDRAGRGLGGGLLLGLSLGAVWTPCAGPALGTILTLAATAADTGRAAWLMGWYAVGAAVPMLAIAYGGQLATTRVRALARHARRLQQASGVVIVLVATALLLHYDTVITVWLLS